MKGKQKQTNAEKLQIEAMHSTVGERIFILHVRPG